MNAIYALAVIVIVLMIFRLLVPSSSEMYRCEKCGFKTANKLEAAGHEKLENTHKTVKE